MDFCLRAVKEAGVAAIPVSAFYEEAPVTIDHPSLLFQARRDPGRGRPPPRPGPGPGRASRRAMPLRSAEREAQGVAKIVLGAGGGVDDQGFTAGFNGGDLDLEQALGGAAQELRTFDGAGPQNLAGGPLGVGVDEQGAQPTQVGGDRQMGGDSGLARSALAGDRRDRLHFAQRRPWRDRIYPLTAIRLTWRCKKVAKRRLDCGAPVDHDGLAGHPGAGAWRPGRPPRRRCRPARPGGAAGCRTRWSAVLGLGGVPEGAGEVGLHQARRDAVDPDVVGRQLLGEVAGQAACRRPWKSRRRRSSRAAQAADRGDDDDRPVAPLLHLRARPCGSASGWRRCCCRGSCGTRRR
jgi:hypothetical protein